MSLELILALVIGGVALLASAGLVAKFAPRRVKQPKFQKQWKELQAYCRHKETWPAALESADKLLEEALRRRRYKGKNMGERLVAAQKIFTDNDGVWQAHKLSKKIIENPNARLTEKDIKNALMNIRQALNDLRVLHK